MARRTSKQISDDSLKQVEHDRLTGGGRGGALNAVVVAVNHDKPTDQQALRELRLRQADAAIEAAQRKVIKQQSHVAGATGARKEKQRAHLKSAEQAVAEAIAAKERLAAGPATKSKKGSK